ncbi:MAG: flap endonuclease-1 [archaeon]|jgi:flap endonuclease-1|nr:flap endonuclease-1 [archaeon]
MGVKLRDLLERDEIRLDSLAGKRIGVDAFNTLYQFLSTIRQKDGTPLMDSSGNITSHLSGLFYRNVRLLEHKILPIYIFDGKPPSLKEDTIKERKARKEEARKKWKSALDEGDLDRAKTYSQATSQLDEKMIDESKKLLDCLGIPHVQAPSEGEAQAAYMCKNNEINAVGSQDYDSLLFGSPILIRNITVSGKRKVPRRNMYVTISPEKIILQDQLNRLGISLENLIEIAVLTGTDFNPGIKGIGAKTALKVIKKDGFETAIEKYNFQVDPYAVKKIFTNPETTDDYNLSWTFPNEEKALELLHEKHEFSRERISNALSKLEEATGSRDQTSLDSW